MATEPANENQPKGEGGRCPICGKPTAPAVRPFCSNRCADVDLPRWLTGNYAIPVVEPDKGIRDGSSEED